MPYVNVAGDRVFYAIHENASRGGAPMVLIHGAAENHLAWPAALRRMPEVRVVAVDLPGHGKSAGAGKTSVAEYAGFVSRLIDALQLARAVIVGHSMGGAVALQFALAYPAHTAALILVATGARLRVDPQILDAARNDPARAADIITRLEWGPGAPDQMVRLGRQQLAANQPGVIYGDYLACDAFDVIDQLGDIRAPTLVIGGTADQLTPPKYAAFLAERIAGARLSLIQDAGHMVMLENEQAVARAVDSFLRDQGLVG